MMNICGKNPSTKYRDIVAYVTDVNRWTMNGGTTDGWPAGRMTRKHNAPHHLLLVAEADRHKKRHLT